jgi:hypothetical protein
MSSENGSTAVDHPDQGNDRSDSVDMTYIGVQPSKWTFESANIREWTEAQLRGRVLNACAGPTRLDHGHEIVTNDLDESLDVDHHIDATQLSEHFGREFDTVLFDPPFSAYQATTHYGGRETGYDTAMKREIAAVLRDGGRVIQFGYTTTCMPRSMDFDRQAVAVFNTLGRQNDILGVVDQRMNHEVTGWSE